MIQDNRVLTSLGLAVCGLCPKDIREVCSAIRINTALMSLDLSKIMFRGQSITSLGKMFITCSGHGYTVDTGSGFCVSGNWSEIKNFGVQFL